MLLAAALEVAEALLAGALLDSAALLVEAALLAGAVVDVAAALSPDESPPRATMVTSQITIASATTMTPMASARRRQ